MPRKYRIDIKASAEIDSESGQIVITTDHTDLGFQIEHDYRAPYSEEEIHEDVEVLNERLMDSPSNHTATITLQSPQ